MTYKMIMIVKLAQLFPLLIWIRVIPLVQTTRYHHRDEKRKDIQQKSSNASAAVPAPLYPTDTYGVYTKYRSVQYRKMSPPLLSTMATSRNINDEQLYAAFGRHTVTEDYTESLHDNMNSSNDNDNNNNNEDRVIIKIDQYQTPTYHIQQQLNQQLHQHVISTCQTVCACKWKGGKQTVECIDRLLMKIPDNIDGSTQVLDLSGNKFQTLLNEQFLRANLLNLQKLYLRNCQIVHIEVQTFRGLTNLVELDLSHNSLRSVPSRALSYISSLRDLTLSSNRINKIESKAFAGIPSLHKLDLSHCDLHEIAARAFEGLEDLTLLRLNGNKLNELVPKTIETLRRLHGIELHDNPWICDCRLRDAKLWLMQKNIPYPVAPICSGGPNRFIERTFNDLHVNDFACKPEMLPINHFVEATTGENASILCRAKAIPEPSISWYWNGRLLSNNTVFSSHQRLIVLEEEGNFIKMSRLLLTNAQEIDSSEFYCVAENRAGSAESNFTLHVRMRAIGMESLASRHIIGLSATLMGLIIFVLIFVLFLAMRLKRDNYTPSKSTNHLEVITNINQHHQNMVINKPQTHPLKNSISGTALSNCIASKNASNDTQLMDAQFDKKENSACSTSSANPLQKPPRLSDMSYANSNSYEKASTLLATSSSLISPTTSIGNNPDLINDTKRFETADDSTNISQNLFRDLKLSNAIASCEYKDMDGDGDISGSGSGGDGNGLLYSSTLWEDLLTAPSICTSSADDIFLRRYTDRTPILESHHQLYDSPESTMKNGNFSKTFPRVTGGPGVMENEDISVRKALALEGSHSTASTTTTNLSNLGSGAALISGYPNDYGLPLVPGAELQYNHHHYHLQNHPFRNLADLGISASGLEVGNRIREATSNSMDYEIDDNNSGYKANRNRLNLNGSRQHHHRPHSGLPMLSNRTLPRHKSTTAVTVTATPTAADTTSALNSFYTSIVTSNLDNINSTLSSSSIQNAPNSMDIMMVKTAENSDEMVSPTLNSKTIRVWQKGGVPVLPPLSAIKRALISSNRHSSPDEGYQEGCGTNV